MPYVITADDIMALKIRFLDVADKVEGRQEIYNFEDGRWFVRKETR